MTASAGAAAGLDVIAAFAERARRWNYCRPVMEDSPGIVIREGRHPVLEEIHGRRRSSPTTASSTRSRRRSCC